MLNFIGKEQLLNAYHAAIKHFNLFLISMLIGVFIGFKVSIWYLDYRINESVKLQGFIHEGIIYDIKVRP